MTSEHPLPLTGERTVPGVPDEAYWFARHVVAYRFAVTRVRDMVVLDAGCGEGYGLQLLAAGGSARVVGADLDGPTATHARRAYGTNDGRITVEQCELMSLPLDDDSIDVTVSFQVIEHLHDIPGYLASLQRVTKPGGLILIGTPNRLTFTPGSDTPVNPFHTIEFAPDELHDVLERAGLAVIDVLGVHHGPRLVAMEQDIGEQLPGRMTVEAATDWPRWYRKLVHTITPDDFVLANDSLDASLDLLAVCRVL